MKVIKSVMSTMKYKYDPLMKVIRSVMKIIKYKYNLLMKVIRLITRTINVKAIYITFYFTTFISKAYWVLSNS